jgi:hypothetical protein
VFEERRERNRPEGATTGAGETHLRYNQNPEKRIQVVYPPETEIICMAINGKKVYTPPQLTVHGTVAGITMATNKDLGGNDGITFQNQPIHWTS